MVSAISSYALSTSQARLASDTSSANRLNAYSGLYAIAKWNLVIINPSCRYHFNNGLYKTICFPKYEPINLLPLLSLISFSLWNCYIYSPISSNLISVFLKIGFISEKTFF